MSLVPCDHRTSRLLNNVHVSKLRFVSYGCWCCDRETGKKGISDYLICKKYKKLPAVSVQLHCKLLVFWLSYRQARIGVGQNCNFTPLDTCPRHEFYPILSSIIEEI
ncbi:Uncharacterized protein TCM_003001 [Theobroma cacao]|uniref:Uncharacterized protein n=1 Tax=Theobroma cacao TaxID=3641 RepID=A0A061DNG3_THECC|nr:Uncharacterized protein TCM_003001 [Theobroma cacao]